MSTFIPFKFKYSLFYVLKPVYLVSQGQYIEGSSFTVRVLNMFIFFKSIVEHFFFNILIIFYLKMKSRFQLFIEILKQCGILLSVFFLLIPFFETSHSQTTIFTKVLDNALENSYSLAAVKYILYENNFLFLILSILVLLIALIGAAIFTSNKSQLIKNNSFYIYLCVLTVPRLFENFFVIILLILFFLV
jgi:hypothetical protein